MEKLNVDTIAFQFMLKEYEKLHGFFDLHYQTVEKTTNFYFIFLGAVASVNGLIYKSAALDIFKLFPIQLILLFIVSSLGSIIYCKVVEHRILIIAYVKGLNVNRRWFVDRSEDPDLERYLYWKSGGSFPKFYEKYRHFYWEALGLGLLNSLFVSISLINLFIDIFHMTSRYAQLLNIVFLTGLTVGLCRLHLYYYKRRGKQAEKGANKRIFEE